jgi:hypothetical protein
MKEEKNIDKLFRERLEGYSEEPPVYVWNGIQDKLGAIRAKKRIPWYRWSAVAALLLLAFMGGWYFSQPDRHSIPHMAENEIIKSEGEIASGSEDSPATLPGKNNSEDDMKEEPATFIAEAESTGKRAGAREKEEVRFIEEPSGAIPEETKLRLRMTQLKPAEAILVSNEQITKLEERSGNSNVKKFSDLEIKILKENAKLAVRNSKEESGWKMGMNISPGYSSYSAKHGATYASNMTYDASEGNANLSGGISVQYKTSKRLSFESGIYYAQNGQQSGSSPQLFGGRTEAFFDAGMAPAQKLYFNTAVNLENSHVAMNSTAGIIEFENLPRGAEIAANLERTGSYSSSLLTDGELSQVFNLVEIPLYLRFLVFESKMNVELVGGVNAGLVVGNNAYIDNQYGMQYIGKTRDISTVNISGTVGVGLSYPLGKNISLAVEPRMNYYMNSINRNPEVNFRPYRAGVYTGLYYEF